MLQASILLLLVSVFMMNFSLFLFYFILLLFGLAKMISSKKIVIPSFDELQNIHMKKKLKKNLASSSKRAKISQRKTLEDTQMR